MHSKEASKRAKARLSTTVFNHETGIKMLCARTPEAIPGLVGVGERDEEVSNLEAVLLSRNKKRLNISRRKPGLRSWLLTQGLKHEDYQAHARWNLQGVELLVIAASTALP